MCIDYHRWLRFEEGWSLPDDAHGLAGRARHALDDLELEGQVGRGLHTEGEPVGEPEARLTPTASSQRTLRRAPASSGTTNWNQFPTSGIRIRTSSR